MTTICIELSDLAFHKQEEVLEAIKKEAEQPQEPEGSYELFVHIEIDEDELRIIS